MANFVAVGVRVVVRVFACLVGTGIIVGGIIVGVIAGSVIPVVVILQVGVLSGVCLVVIVSAQLLLVTIFSSLAALMMNTIGLTSVFCCCSALL